MTTTPVTVTDQGYESHPSFGLVAVGRVTSNPATPLFDASLPADHFITLTLSTAERHRQLHNDYIHERNAVVQVSMTQDQWARVVSSVGNGNGVPVTITRLNGALVPQAPAESRLALSAQEVADTARKATERITAANLAVQAGFAANLGRKLMAPLLKEMQLAVEQTPGTMKFAADQLTAHTDRVVSAAMANFAAAQGQTAENVARQLDAMQGTAPAIES